MKDEKKAMWQKGNDTNKAKTQNDIKLLRNDKFKIRWVWWESEQNGIGWLTGAHAVCSFTTVPCHAVCIQLLFFFF